MNILANYLLTMHNFCNNNAYFFTSPVILYIIPNKMQNINFCHFSDYKEFLKFLLYNNAESLQYPCESCYCHSWALSPLNFSYSGKLLNKYCPNLRT